MTKNYALLILLITGLLFAACSKSDIENENSYEKSLKVWTSFKESSGNSYRYTVSLYRWPDHRNETTITVTRGKVTQRHYKNTSVAGLERIPEEGLEWIENEIEINTHENTNAAQPLTLDQIYVKAQEHWLLKRKGTSTTFEAKNNGMISTCGFSVDGCQDDCFDGINVTAIEALK